MIAKINSLVRSASLACYSTSASLLVGWTILTMHSTAEAQMLDDQVDIIDGLVDVDQTGVIDASDDINDVLLFFNNAAPIRVDVIDGLVDVSESGSIAANDDLQNANLSVHVIVGGSPAKNRVDILNGYTDVDENGAIGPADDLLVS